LPSTFYRLIKSKKNTLVQQFSGADHILINALCYFNKIKKDNINEAKRLSNIMNFCAFVDEF